jgi:DNA segregation ATPase FtsK/SpoIIIE-like protein
MNAEQETLDRHYPAAVAIVSAAGYGSNWLLRDRLNLSYRRASFLIAALRAAGILGDELDEEARFKLIEPRGFH